MINLIGIPEPDGLVKDQKLGYLQNSVVRGDMASVFEGHGSNDGYVEYPGTAIPDDFADNVFTLSADAGHIVLDARWEQFSLEYLINQSALLDGVLRALAERL